jgi:maltooligosyltrehalose trehalohydrolase
MVIERQYSVGAEPSREGVHFRVWAPRHGSAAVVLQSGDAKKEHPLEHEAEGYFSAMVLGAKVSDRYHFRLGGGVELYPDPASRFQPEGPHGPSQVIDPTTYEWSDGDWKGASLRGQVIYELHIGTFTREGTWVAAMCELPELADLGITVIEVMPVNEFAGNFGWGYDGVDLFAPSRLYGEPDDFRRFVDAAHSAGIAVILDVVYNHFGPDGNYLPQFGPYLSSEHKNEWGDNVNFDGEGSPSVREFIASNAGYWIDEFHLDGLRIDATQAIIDDSPEHILVEIGRCVRKAAKGRETIIVNENESQLSKMIRPIERRGYGLDGMWNDDFHHSAMVALNGRNEAYYSDHLATPQEFISAAKYGYLFQGQRYSWQEQRRGAPAFDIAPWRFVNFIQNHDQIANSGRGLRCRELSSPGRFRAVTAMLLLFPGTPMLFMGQEFSAAAPFHYFADHTPELAKLVHLGRTEFMTQFRSLDRPDLAGCLPEPHDRQTFARCKLDFADRSKNAREYQLHKDLLRLRRDDPAFHPRDARYVDGAVLGSQAFVLRYFQPTGDDRLLLVNFGRDLHLDQTPEPLLAPPEDSGWKVLWSSEAPEYGGDGTATPETMGGWRLMGESAMVLAPEVLPPVDTKAARKETENRAKERKYRERTRL